MKPGLSRGISMGILGFLLGMVIVIIIRWLQSMDPIWDPGIALVLAPFTSAAGVVWGMGGFDPRMNVHGEHHEEEEEDGTPGSILMGQIWQISAWTVFMLLVLFAFALLPTGLRLEVTGDPQASFAEIDTAQEFLLPLGVGTFEASQLSVFVGFIIFTLFSLALVGGGIGLVMYLLSRGVEEVKNSETTDDDLTPPRPVRFVGAIFGWLARVLRGIPAFLGQK